MDLVAGGGAEHLVATVAAGHPLGRGADPLDVAPEHHGEALIAPVTNPVRGMPSVEAAVDLLTDALLSHLSYEEHQLLEPLARFGPALYGW